MHDVKYVWDQNPLLMYGFISFHTSFWIFLRKIFKISGGFLFFWFFLEFLGVRQTSQNRQENIYIKKHNGLSNLHVSAISLFLSNLFLSVFSQFLV